jgi:hypothetical protein
LVSVIPGVFILLPVIHKLQRVSFLSYLLSMYSVFVCLFYDWSCDSTVTEMARLPAEWQKKWGLILEMESHLNSPAYPDWLWGPTSLSFNG